MSYFSNTKLAILALIIANIIWGAAFPIYKLSLTNIPPFTFVFLRFFIGALIFLPFTYKHLKIKTKDIPVLIFLSLSGITLGISFMNFGLKLSSSINAPIIASASPIILIIASFFYLKEKVKRKVVLGTLISFCGVLTIVLMPLFTTTTMEGSVSGNIFFVFATMFTVIHAILLKKILPKYNFLTIAFWSCLIGSLPLIPLVNNEFVNNNWINTLTLPVILGLLFAIIFATVIAHAFSTFGIKYISTSEIGIFSYVDPIATILVAVPLLNETITPTYILGALLVFGGIFISEGRIHYHPFHRLLR